MAIVSQSPSVSEVKAVLAETSNSVGGLCTSKKINKWSKWKPVRYSKMGGITEDNLTMLGFGLKARGSNNPTDASFSTTSSFFEYLSPRGWDGYREPYRLGDFRKYNNIAEPFIVSDEQKKRLSYNKIFEFGGSSEGTIHSGVLEPNDIINSSPNVEINYNSIGAYFPSESYLGVLFYVPNRNQMFYSAYNIRWSDLDASSISWGDLFPSHLPVYGNNRWQENVFKPASLYDIRKGDNVYVYYCSVPLNFYDSLGEPQSWREGSDKPNYWSNLFESEDVIHFIDKGLNNLFVVSPEKNHGNGIIRIDKIDFQDKNHIDLYNHKRQYDLYNDGKLVININRDAYNTITASYMKIPFSLFYFKNVSGNASASLNIRFEIKHKGINLLSQDVNRTVTNHLTEVSGTAPTDGSANFYINTDGGATTNTSKAESSEDEFVWAEGYLLNAKGEVIRTIVSGRCTLYNSGNQYWVWYS